MENDVKMASEAQINYLKKLGYAGSTANLTAEQASNLIKARSNGANTQPRNENPFSSPQPFYQNESYQQPTPQYQQPQQYQQPTPKAQAPIVSAKQDYSITTRTGEVLDLNPDVVNAYISPDVPLTPVEFNYFFSVCKTYELNPFLKDIYAIKFGNQPATFIIDYKVMQQAADNNPMFDGLKVGVLYLDATGQPKERDGAYILPGETLIGGWCDVFRKDRTHTNRTYALYEENVKTTKDGKPNTNWATKPVFMCVKVAKAQALREAFPNMFSNNTYTSDEMDKEEAIVVNQDYAEPTVEDVNKKQEKKTASKKATPVESNEWPE